MPHHRWALSQALASKSLGSNLSRATQRSWVLSVNPGFICKLDTNLILTYGEKC